MMMIVVVTCKMPMNLECHKSATVVTEKKNFVMEIDFSDEIENTES